MNRLYLVRHGENLANLTMEFSYRNVDYSLTPKGVLQASQTAAYCAGLGIQEFYSSPLKRARETAEIIAGPYGLPVTTLENFREVNIGDLEGQNPTPALWKFHNNIIASWLDGHPEMRFPGGEDYHTLQARAVAGFTEMLTGKDGRSMLLVAHGGIFSFTLRGLVAGLEQDLLNTPMPNCGVTELEGQVVDGRLELRLVSYSSAAHLSGEAAQLVRGFPKNEELIEVE